MRVLLVPNASVPPAVGTAELADAVVARLADLVVPPPAGGTVRDAR